jgi:hypothetical protein
MQAGTGVKIAIFQALRHKAAKNMGKIAGGWGKSF